MWLRSVAVGSLAAMSIFESEYQENMDEEGAKAIVAKAIRAGKFAWADV